MEEDNAIDVLKYVSSTPATPLGDTFRVVVEGASYEAEVRSKGNLLTVHSSTEPIEPLVFVLERFHLKKEPDEDGLFPFSVLFSEESVKLFAKSAEQREKWMIQLATSSHQMAQAALDETAYKLFTMDIASTASEASNSQGSSFQNFFLTNPFSVAHNFSIASQNNLPSRRILFEETMWESKLSIILPLEMIKLYKKWNAELCGMFEARQISFPPDAINSLHDVLRQLRENSETYEQSYEFLQNYSGPSFRRSVEKTRVAFSPCPTNMHVQYYGIQGDKAACVIGSGTTSCLPLRFHHGGLHRLFNAMDVSPSWSDMKFAVTRQEFLQIKRSIGEISRRLDTEWTPKQPGRPDKISIELTMSIKQLNERLRDLLRSVPEADESADAIMEAQRRRSEKGLKVDCRIPDSIQNQLDSLEAMLISLDTKVAVIDSLDDSVPERSVYVQSAREAMAVCLDGLLALTDSLVETQLLGLVHALGRSQSLVQYFHCQIRLDFVLSQAITIAATALLVRIQQGWPEANGSPLPPLLVIFSWLSAYGDEKGMIEDAIEAWKVLENRVTYKFVRAPSAVCRTCIPMVSGHRSSIQISIPIPHETFDSLNPKIGRAEGWKMNVSYWNIGVNHEASLGQQWGGIPFESYVNTNALQKIQDFSRIVLGLDTTAKEALTELTNTVHTEPSRKNMAIFDWLMAASPHLGAQIVIGCKSGKDRTGMGITLEQGRVLRETQGLSQTQVSEIVDSLRREGVRLENCRKNVGKAAYAFSPFQMHFLPKSFRPPSGTASHSVAS